MLIGQISGGQYAQFENQTDPSNRKFMAGKYLLPANLLRANLFPWMQVDDGNAKKAAPNAPDLYANMMSMGQEITDLCAQRAKAYADLQRQLKECQHPEELDEVRQKFWNAAYDQYHAFSSHNMPGPMAVLDGMIDGQLKNAAQAPVKRTTAKPVGKTASKARGSTAKSATAKRKNLARRKPSGNGSGLYSYPEHVEGRHQVKGRMH